MSVMTSAGTVWKTLQEKTALEQAGGNQGDADRNFQNRFNSKTTKHDTLVSNPPVCLT